MRLVFSASSSRSESVNISTLIVFQYTKEHCYGQWEIDLNFTVIAHRKPVHFFRCCLQFLAPYSPRRHRLRHCAGEIRLFVRLFLENTDTYIRSIACQEVAKAKIFARLASAFLALVPTSATLMANRGFCTAIATVSAVEVLPTPGGPS